MFLWRNYQLRIHFLLIILLIIPEIKLNGEYIKLNAIIPRWKFILFEPRAKAKS